MLPRRRLCFRLSTAGVIATTALLPSAALATYSIAATDSQTQEVGGAITSCVGSLDVGIVYGSLPGVGVVHAQAQLDQRGRAKTRAIELLEMGVDPAQVITEITRRDFDASFATRQYGIVDLSGRAAGFTGTQAQAYKNDQQGTFERFTYSVQGNILTSQAVLDQTAEAFREPACDLAERLMRALEAGADNGEGDSRCTGAGIPSDSAYIRVDRPGQSEPYLELNVAGTRPNNTLPQLRELFDAWRATHPCPMPESPAAGSGGAAAAAGSGATGGSVEAGAGADGGAAGAGAAGVGADSGTAGAGAETTCTGPGAAVGAGAAGVGGGADAGICAGPRAGAAGSSDADTETEAMTGPGAANAGARAGAGAGAAGVGAGANAGAVRGIAGATSRGTNTGAAARSGVSAGANAPASVSAGTGTSSSVLAETPAASSGSCALTHARRPTPLSWLLIAAALCLAPLKRRRRTLRARAQSTTHTAR